jgi:uncharacterized protein YqjF (DUF2071 family)
MILHPSEPPVAVTDPVMLNDWRDLTFVHWSYDPGAVQSLLPPGLEVETFDDRAWVGLVPFHMVVSHPRFGAVPWVSRFLETNVRTYVRGPNGEVGVFFFSLEAERLGAVIVGRGAYGVPYYWAHMHARADGERRTYVTHRRWPDRGARSALEIEIGEPISKADVSEFEHYLTARWALFGVRRGAVTFARADHPRWSLHRARLLAYRDELIPAAGLPDPAGEPVVHWSGGVSVRIGRPSDPM